MAKRVNGREKGAKFEREVAKLLSAWWGEDFNRVPMSGGLNWGKDSRVTGDIAAPVDSEFPFSVECKKQEGWALENIFAGTGNVPSWWEQCTRDADKLGRVPLLVFSKNRTPIFFMVRIEDFKKYNIKSNYMVNTINLKDRVDVVGIGYFDRLTEIDKDKILSLYKN